MDATGAGSREPLGPDETSALRFADVVLDEWTREVWRGGARIELTPTEFGLLRFFLINPRRVLTKQQILDGVWDAGFEGDLGVVETYVSYLRKKLDPLGPRLIHTVRLVGYALREADPQARESGPAAPALIPDS